MSIFRKVRTRALPPSLPPTLSLTCPFSLAIAAGRFISLVGVSRARTAAPVNNSQRLLPCRLSTSPSPPFPPCCSLTLLLSRSFSRATRAASNANTPPSNSVSRPAKIISNYAPAVLPDTTGATSIPWLSCLPRSVSFSPLFLSLSLFLFTEDFLSFALRNARPRFLVNESLSFSLYRCQRSLNKLGSGNV